MPRLGLHPRISQRYAQAHEAATGEVLVLWGDGLTVAQICKRLHIGDEVVIGILMTHADIDAGSRHGWTRVIGLDPIDPKPSMARMRPFHPKPQREHGTFAPSLSESCYHGLDVGASRCGRQA